MEFLNITFYILFLDHSISLIILLQLEVMVYGNPTRVA